MTQIQQVHWELVMDYIGHPYYVSGNAILHALAAQSQADMPNGLHASHGVFVPGQYGVFPEAHSQSNSHPHLGSGLHPVECYEDLFLFRDPAHSWLIQSRPRDALNTHDIRLQSGHPALAHETIMGRPEEAYQQHQSTQWYLSAYLHAEDPGILPISESRLDGVQFGGRRNYGYGQVQLKDTQLVDLEALDYSRLETAETTRIELVTPFVLHSEHPNADEQSVPWWWDSSRECLRERKEKILEGGDVYDLQTIDHGQRVTYTGTSPVETAKNGLLRVGSHAKCGFGELRLRPVERGGSRWSILNG